MAKEQDLSLTPSSISGVCGRLKCCLKFEHDVYLELEKDMPRKGEYCDTPAGRGKICDRNLLSRKVSVAFESGNIATFSVDEINTAAQEKRDGKPKNNVPKGKNGRENPGKGKNNKKHSGNGNQSK